MIIKPFIRWSGGKQGIVHELIEQLPDINSQNSYFEPFIGAGSLFLSNSYHKNIISDSNEQLVNTYKTIKHNYKQLHKNILLLESDYLLNQEIEYYNIRKKYNEERGLNTCIQAARFIFLVQSNYNGMFRVNQKGEYNVPWGKKTPKLPSLENLKLVSKKLASTTIMHADFKDVLLNAIKGDVIYLDPPYPLDDWSTKQNQYTANFFTQEEHNNLFKIATNLSLKGCRVIISYPNFEIIKEKYSNWNIKQLTKFRSISCKKERKVISELIIKNF